MNTTQFSAEAQPMMDAVDAAMSRMFGEPTEAERRARLEQQEDEFLARKHGYLRICNANETLAEVMAEASRCNAALYLRNGAYIISSNPLVGCQRVAPIFEPIKPLEAA